MASTDRTVENTAGPNPRKCAVKTTPSTKIANGSRCMSGERSQTPVARTTTRNAPPYLVIPERRSTRIRAGVSGAKSITKNHTSVKNKGVKGFRMLQALRKAVSSPAKGNSSGEARAMTPTGDGARAAHSIPEPATSATTRPGLLLLLDGFQILIEVRNALLHFGLVSLAEVAEQRAPNRHIFAAVGWGLGLAAKHAGDVQRWILSFIVRRQFGEVGRGDFQGRGSGAATLAVGAVTHGAVTGVHLLARSGAGLLQGNVLDHLLLGRLLRQGECREDRQAGAEIKPFACLHVFPPGTAVHQNSCPTGKCRREAKARMCDVSQPPVISRSWPQGRSKRNNSPCSNLLRGSSAGRLPCQRDQSRGTRRVLGGCGIQPRSVSIRTCRQQAAMLRTSRGA